MAGLTPPLLPSSSYAPATGIAESAITGLVTDLAAKVPTALPSNAGTRTRVFDPALSVYNKKASNTRKLRAAIAAAYANTALGKFVWIGDSKIAGNNSTSDFNTASMPGQVRALLASAGLTVAGTGLVIGSNNYSPGDPRWTFVGAWTRTGQNDKPAASVSANGATATFVSDKAGTVVDIYTYGTTAGFTYNIDGAGAVAITPSGSGATQKISVTGLANTVHTVVITTTSASLNFLLGIDVHNTTGLWFANVGVGNSGASDWVSVNYYQSQQVAKSIGATVALISIGINDARTGVAVATYKTNLTTLVTNMQLTCDVVLIVPTPGQTTTITTAVWDTYVSAMYDVADSNDVPLIDLTDRFGLWATANTLGLMDDNLHETKAGYAADAAVIARVLAA